MNHVLPLVESGRLNKSVKMIDAIGISMLLALDLMAGRGIVLMGVGIMMIIFGIHAYRYG